MKFIAEFGGHELETLIMFSSKIIKYTIDENYRFGAAETFITENKSINKMCDPFCCNHANEVPNICPCTPNCYCRIEGSCKNISK